ncbi:MAG: RagB/SusD family nutrient uptake outer membrane protein [Bacteroidales bacterium]
MREAVLPGSLGAAITPLAAVNTVRERAGLDPLASVTIDDVMDEKFAEFGMEWGIRYRDMVRLQRYDELSYEGREFTEDKIFLPYPQARVDALPQLAGK